MARHEFLVLIPPTTGVSTYRASVARDLADYFPEVLGLTAPAFACRCEFFDVGLKQRDLDVLTEAVLEALVKAGVMRDDAAIETLITSRSTDGPAGFVRVTLLELDAVTKAAVAKTFALEPWTDKGLRSTPEGSPGGLVLDTAFYNLSLVTTGGGGTSKNYRFEGTDAETGQVFDSTRPRLWGGPLDWQLISDNIHTPDETFTLTPVTGQDDLPAPGNALQIVRNYDFANACQAALKFLPTDAWTAQGMALIGLRFRLPTGYPVTTNHQFTLCEIKSQGGNAPYPVVHLLASRENIGGTDKWALKLGAVRIDGANVYDTWGDDATPTVATASVTPSQDAYYDGKFFKVIGDGTLSTEAWYTVIFGFRLKTHNGNVAGNKSDGWVASWLGLPNGLGEPAAWNACTLMQLVTGRNLGYVTEPTADYVFVLNHYNTSVSGATGKAMNYRSRLGLSFTADWPTIPAAIDAIENPSGGGTEVAPAFRAASSDATTTSGDGTINIPKPTGTASGDVVLLAVQVTNNSTAGSWGSVTWPSGFTEQASIGADPSAWNKLLVATKIAGGSEPSTYDVTYGESGGPYRVIGAAVAYQAPNTTLLDVTPVTQNNAANASTAQAPSITPSNANQKRLVTIYGISDGNATTDGRSLAPPAGQTERVEVVAGTTAYSRLMIADEVYASASATGTRSATITGGDCESQAISLLLRGKVP